MKLSDTSKGIIFLIISTFFFALMAVFVRLAGDIHFIQKAFFRNAVAFVIALVGILREVRKEGKASVAIPKGALLFLFLRAISGSVGVFGNFYAIDHILLADATILLKMAPFFTIIFCYFMLKEKINLVSLIFISVAFLGAVFVIKPSWDFSKMLPTLAAVAAGVGAGLAYTSVRKLSYLKCNGKLVILFFSCFSMLLSVPYMIVNFNPMTLHQTLMLCCAGACAAGGQFSVTAAYYHAPASRISIYDYSQIIFSTIFGFLFFGQLPDALSLVGYAIIISMAIANFAYNKKSLPHVSEN